jgi:hypothetical protein
MLKLRRILLVFTVLAAMNGRAQWLWDYGGMVGASNYLGDIGGKEKTRRDFVADMKLAKTRWNVGGFVRYKWRPRLSLKLAVDYIRLEGNDALSSNPGRRYRNFNFRNDIYDAAFTGEFFFYENNDLGNTYRYRNGFRAYLFAGVGAFLNNPKTLYQGSWVALRPLQTEGVEYKLLQANIPMGVGFYFTFNKKHRIGFEMNYRKTFTDYIDDISDKYPATPVPGYLGGVIMRKNELDLKTQLENPGAYNSHDWGLKRGDPSHKDSYVTVGFSYSYVIRGKASFYRVRNTGFFNQKRRMRKIRAKF